MFQSIIKNSFSESGVMMCKVREGANVVSSSDLQNLVASVILRQTSTFSTEDVYSLICAKLKGSAFIDSPEVERRCKETISALFTVNCLKSIEPDRYKLNMSFPSVARR